MADILIFMIQKILMCQPKYFGIEYEINSWMHTENKVDYKLAQKQWQQLYDIYTKKLGWEVEMIEPVEGLPDMVFATDCCVIKDDKILLSNFRYQERKPETDYFEAWLYDNGYKNIKRAENIFEGGGDNMLCGDKIIAGFGFRSEIGAAKEMQKYFDCEVISIRNVDPYFYHLDTSMAVLSHDTVAYYPGAIDEESQKRLKLAVPNLIEATHEEAKGFGLNAVSNGKIVITSNESESLLQKYREAGFEVHGTPITEFKKSGGGVKCMTLSLKS